MLFVPSAASLYPGFALPSTRVVSCMSLESGESKGERSGSVQTRNHLILGQGLEIVNVQAARLQGFLEGLIEHNGALFVLHRDETVIQIRGDGEL